jgi:predicted RNA-binding Zn-ribbon protein involved in translation (DUF1610 family)
MDDQAHDSATPAGRQQSPQAVRLEQMLVDFLREHDAYPTDPPVCPVCGYNLKALTKPVCPECGNELMLTVGAARHPIGWLLAALAPGFFSGIAACFVLIPIIGQTFFGNGRPEPLFLALDSFGWCSGLFAILLAMKRSRFLAQSRLRQRWFAIIIWLIHIAALGVFILLVAISNF